MNEVSAFEEAAAALRGSLDRVDRRVIAGWAADEGGPTSIEIFDNGVLVGEALALAYRADLRGAVGEDGRHAFELRLDPPLSALSSHLIEVRRTGDGAPLPGSSVLLLPAPEFDAPLRDRLSTGIEAWAQSAQSRTEIELGLEYLQTAVERLLQAAAQLADEPPERPRLAPMPAPSMLAAPEGELAGNLEEGGLDTLRGWAADSGAPDRPTLLEIVVDGVALGSFPASETRPDLAEAGYGAGNCGFNLRVVGLTCREPRALAVWRAVDRALLEGSPVAIEPAPREALWPNLAEAFDGIADAASKRADLDPPLVFLRMAAGWLAEARPDLLPPAVEPVGPAALVIDDHWPVPERDAGSNAVLDHMRSLIRLGFRVSFAAAVQMQRLDSAALAEIGAEWRCAPDYGSVEEVLRRHAGRFDLVYLHRVSNARKYGALVRHYCPRARQLYSVADLYYLRRQRQAAVEGRIELVAEAQRLKLAELAAAAFADAVVTHSAAEAALLRREVKGLETHVVPWSVEPRPRRVPFAERRGLALIGGYNHDPNVDAALWLIREIMPLVWREDPLIPCLVVGRDIPEGILRHVRPGIVLVGPVATLDEIFDAVRLSVAPLRYGAGVKGKVVDSLAAGIPCVATPIAGEGLGLPAELKGALAETAEAFAAEICRLHRDEKANARAAEAGLAFVATALAPQRIDELMRRAVGTALSARRPG